jgi:GMP synthase-like glutamine amidotransferase
MTRIAILTTGAPPAALVGEHGDYPAMFRTMLGDQLPTTAFDVQHGEWPDPVAFTGAIITGSAAGVYEGDAWIGALFDWIRMAKGELKMVGVCFGHQAMAQALGGRVEKSERGWGVGLHRYDVVSREPWMEPWAASVALPVSHQDQVVEQPADARVWLASDFAPLAGLAWGDDAISLQAHPEFTPAYTTDLVEGRRGRIEAALVDRATESLREANERDLVSGWIRTFLS